MKSSESGEGGDDIHCIPWAVFLEMCPPGTFYPVKNVVEVDGPFLNLSTPDITLLCDNRSCQKKTRFTYNGIKLPIHIGKRGDYALRYVCADCRVSEEWIHVYLEIRCLFGTNRAMKY